MRALAAALPGALRQRWRLIFSTRHDGVSLTRLIATCRDRAPCLVLLRAASVAGGGGGGALLGGFASTPLRPSPKWGGGYGSFVFSLSPGAPAVYRASGENASFVYLNSGMDELPNGLAFGGHLESRSFALWLHADLDVAESSAAGGTTFHSPCLGGSDGCGTAKFGVDAVEVWAVGEDPPPPTEEEAAAAAGENALTAAGVLSSKHDEARAFVQLASKGPKFERSGGS